MKKLRAKVFYMAAISVAKHYAAADSLVEKAKKLAKEKRIVFSDVPTEGYSCHAVKSSTTDWEESERYKEFFYELCESVNGKIRTFWDRTPSAKWQEIRYFTLIKAARMLEI